MSTTSIQKRNFPGNNAQDPGAISNLTYNNAAGSDKVSEVGRCLIPFPVPGTGNGYTADLSGGAYALPGAGKNIAVYNSTGTVGSVTFGSTSSLASLGAGVTNSSGNVGLPCMPNSWSYFAAGYNNYIISSGSTLMVFLIVDDTSIQVVAPALISNNTYPNL